MRYYDEPFNFLEVAHFLGTFQADEILDGNTCKYDLYWARVQDTIYYLAKFGNGPHSYYAATDDTLPSLEPTAPLGPLRAAAVRYQKTLIKDCGECRGTGEILLFTSTVKCNLCG